MSDDFLPADSINERHGCFVALVAGTNAGKTFSGLRLAKGLAGDRKVAVLDTEGGRTLHLKKDFAFDVRLLDPPFRPERFAEVARKAEAAGYGCLLIDSFSMEWVGMGGVLDWQEQELEAAVQRALSREDNRRSEYAIREANKMAAWIKPKGSHKAMVYSFLQRRMPIIFAIRGEETVKPGENGKPPQKLFKAITHKSFPFEMTVSFRLAAEKKGVIDLSDPASFKMEGAHREIFKNGEQLSERHGEALAAWARGDGPEAPPPPVPLTFHYEDGRTKVLATPAAWEKLWLASDGPVANLGPDKLRHLLGLNGAVMGEIAGQHPEAVMKVQQAIAAKLGVQRLEVPEDAHA